MRCNPVLGIEVRPSKILSCRNKKTKKLYLHIALLKTKKRKKKRNLTVSGHWRKGLISQILVYCKEFMYYWELLNHARATYSSFRLKMFWAICFYAFDLYFELSIRGKKMLINVRKYVLIRKTFAMCNLLNQKFPSISSSSKNLHCEKKLN